MPLNEDMLNILACPKCMGDLNIIAQENTSETGLACNACALVYPLENDIPVLLIEDARPLTAHSKE